MGIEIIKGDLFDTDCQVIAHQVNCQGVMGSGVALQVKKKYPQAYKSYMSFLKNSDSIDALGRCQLVECDGKNIANIYGQNRYGYNSNIRYTNMNALESALEELMEHMRVLDINSVAFPYKMASDRGGANWDDVLELIREYFKDFDVKIYKLR